MKSVIFLVSLILLVVLWFLYKSRMKSFYYFFDGLGCVFENLSSHLHWLRIIIDWKTRKVFLIWHLFSLVLCTIVTELKHFKENTVAKQKEIATKRVW